jgi:endonuclease/exonuclease/phosphatase family metal-dependent hydrolase
VAAAQNAVRHGPGYVRVMTRNLYLGADIVPIVDALANPDPNNPYAVPIETGKAIANVLGTNVPDRLGAVADEIAVTLPHVVGLQEVTTYTIADPTGQLPAEIDFLAILEDQLAARGLDYQVVSTVANFGVPAPGLPACLSPDCSVLGYVSLQDHDVLLVRGDVQVNAVPDPVTYQAAVPLGDGLPPITRGLVAANLTVGGKTFTAVNTHFELGGATELAQLGQAQEFIARFGDAGPVLALGDFNAPADSSTAYSMLTDAGFKDRWTTNMFSRDGYTCCFDETATTGDLYERIDLVFTKDLPVSRSFSWRIGSQPFERIASGQYPSDHAGVVSWIFFKK